MKILAFRWEEATSDGGRFLFGIYISICQRRKNASDERNKTNDGGEGGIRTPDTLSGMAAFEAARFNRSRTSPRRIIWLERPFLFYQREYLHRLVPLAFGAKELAEHLRTSVAQHSSRDFHLVIQLRMIQNIHY